jgi:hypothetical protein
MTEASAIWSSEVSRRCLLWRAACTAGAVTILGTSLNAAMAGKMSQAAVGYQPTPNGANSCANCRIFVPPNACRSVEGSVSVA